MVRAHAEAGDAQGPPLHPQPHSYLRSQIEFYQSCQKWQLFAIPDEIIL